MTSSIERSDIKPILQELIEIAALPLKHLERDFAIDATGFGTVNHIRYFDYRHRKDLRCKTWRKCHAMCGVKTNIITSVEVTRGLVNDATQFEPLARSTARNFKIAECSADKAYLSKNSYNLLASLGGQAYIPYKKHMTGKSKEGGNSFIWRQKFRYFRDHQEEFMQKYHKRSNIESCFSMIKRKFGNSVRCRKETSQDNEILAKVVCHNLCVLIQEMFLSDVEVDFDFCAEHYVARN